MASNAISGVGAKLLRNDPAIDNVYTQVGEVTNIDGPSPTADKIDVTNFDSGLYREFIAGFKDAGDVTVDMNFTNATYKQALGDFNSGALLNYRVQWADTDESYVDFAAVNIGITSTTPTDDKVSSTITLSASGEPVFGDNTA